MSHQCPGPDCKRTVPDHLLMCRNHWYQVPRHLRDAVWDAYQDGAGAGTGELRDAQGDAIDSLQGGQL